MSCTSGWWSPRGAASAEWNTCRSVTESRADMRTVLATALVLLVAITLGGCAGSPGGELFRPAKLGPDQAVIYIFRPSERAMRSAPIAVFINQEYQGEVRPGQHMAYIVEPGGYLVRVEAAASMVCEVRVVAGDVAYQRVTMKSRSRPIIDVVEPELGRRLISGSRLVTPPEEPNGSTPETHGQIESR